MAKKMKKLLAVLLALTLVAGQISLSVAASGDPLPSGDPGSSGSGGTLTDPQTTTVPVDGGTQTTITGTDAATGAEVTITLTQTDDGAGTTQQSITGESVLVTGGGTRTDIQTEWESITTETGSDTTGTNPVTTTDTDKTTTVTGSESTTQTVTHQGNTEHVQQTQKGEEETTIDGTTVTTTTETGVVTGHETVDGNGTQSKEDPTTTRTDNDPVEGAVTSEKDFTYGELQEGTDKTQTGETVTGTTVDLTHEGDVTVSMTPDGQWVEKKITVSKDDLDLDNLPEGATVTETADGNYLVTYKEQVTTDSKPASTTDPQPGSWTAVGDPQNTYIHPGNYTTGSTTTGDDLTKGDGESVTVTYEDIFDANGKYLGYKIITTTTTKTTADPVDNPVGTNTQASSSTVAGQPSTTYTAPANIPVDSVTDNVYGGKTTVTVTETMDSAGVKTYHVLTEIRAADGSLIRREERSLYDTEHTEQTTVTTDPTAERTTTTTLVTKTETQEVYTIQTTQEMQMTETQQQFFNTTIVEESDLYEIVEAGEDKYFLYQGKMYRVVATDAHGTTQLNGLQPMKDLITDPDADTDLYDKNGTDNGFYKAYADMTDKELNKLYADGFDYLMVGNGHASTHGVYRNNGNKVGTITNHQFALRAKDGSVFYVYCADMSTDVVPGASYEVQNVEDASYYQGTDAADHIKAICKNGYWGTASGTGSMEAIKALLNKYGYTDAANNITEGEALSATQAAIWTFGNSESGRNVRQENAIEDSTYGEVLYKLLISEGLMNDTDDTSTDLLDSEDIRSSSITVHNAVTDTSGNAVTDAGGNAVYNTTVTFNVSVEKSAFTGNMVVKLTQGNKVVASVDLATADSNLIGKIFNDGTAGSTDIVFEGVELAEGVKVDLTIDGKQTLEEGVYLYTAKGGYEAAQTFVGVASGERDVHLKASVEFKVENPEVTKTNTKTTYSRTDHKNGERLNTRLDTTTNTETVNSSTTKNETIHDIDIISTVETVETRRQITRENRKWEAFCEYLLTTINDEDGEENITIEDEDVPLADAPKTGDISGLWAAVSAVSLAGAAFLSVKRKDEEA